MCTMGQFATFPFPEHNGDHPNISRIQLFLISSFPCRHRTKRHRGENYMLYASAIVPRILVLHDHAAKDIASLKLWVAQDFTVLLCEFILQTGSQITT